MNIGHESMSNQQLQQIGDWTHSSFGLEYIYSFDQQKRGLKQEQLGF